MVFEDKQIVFIGAGVMGEAMIKGLLSQSIVSPEHITVADPNHDRVEQLKTQYGIQGTLDNVQAAKVADILILSVKPQVMDRVMHPLRGRADHIDLILSIAAGVKLATITGGLLNSRVVRSMPNTPAQIGEGISVWTATPEVEATQREQAAALLGAMGEQIYVDDEKYLDMTTALSGTGPAYVFLFMEALVDVGVHMGFSRRDAEKLVLHTVRGSVDFAMSSDLHTAQLRNQVTSPGGTTASALYELEKGGLRTVISDAVWAAYRRSVELGNES